MMILSFVSLPLAIAILIICLFVLIFFWYFFKIISKKESEKSFSAYPIDLSDKRGKVISALRRIDKAILSNLDYEKVVEDVVDLVLKELDYMQAGYKICVLTLVDKKEGVVKRISFSQTPEAFGVLSEGRVKFHEVKIPFSAEENVLVRAIKDKKIYITHDLSDVFYPEKTRDVWREVQKKIGIKTSLIFPLVVRDESIGAMIFSLTKNEEKIAPEEKETLAGFTDAVALALENASLYRKLEVANKKLQDLDQRKDEFLNVAAHELRAPMTAIKGYLSMILDGDAGKVPQKAVEFLEYACEGNERLVRLVNNLLNVGRIEEGRVVYQMGLVNLSKVVEDVFNDYKIEVQEKKLDYRLDIAENIKDLVYVDQDRIHEIVSNLVGNAVKYVDKGSITVVLKQTDPEKIYFEVADTGLGMSESDQQKMFKKFSRGEASGGKSIGTGLGLYISKLLVEKFNGEIGLKSELGKGSVFWFQLPLYNGQMSNQIV